MSPTSYQTALPRIMNCKLNNVLSFLFETAKINHVSLQVKFFLKKKCSVNFGVKCRVINTFLVYLSRDEVIKATINFICRPYIYHIKLLITQKLNFNPVL